MVNKNNNFLFLKNQYLEVHRARKKRYSPMKVKWRNFLTNILDKFFETNFNNASFIVLCTYFSTWIRFFLSKNLMANTIERVYKCYRHIFIYIFICQHDNFNDLSKLLKFQNASEIVSDFIVENNKYFARRKEYFKRNAQLYQ